MNRLLLTLIAVGLSPLGTAAQTPPPIDPPELVAMREEHLRSIQRASIPILTAYVRQLESQKGVFTRQGKLDAALAIDKELKETIKQLEAANAAAARSGASLQLTILSASYGAEKKTTDTTKVLRKALQAGKPTLKLNTQDGAAGVDPAPYAPKMTTIVYSINGQRKEKTFPEGRVLNFKEDLN